MFRRSGIGGIALIGLIGGAPALADLLSFSHTCDNVWQTCCGGDTTKFNNWGRSSPAPLCPGLPTTNDDVVIFGDCLIAAPPDPAAACRTLEQSGGVFILNAGLQIAQEAHFDGPVEWNAGAIARAGAAASQFAEFNAGLSMQGAAEKTLSYFGGFRAINRATATWSGDGPLRIGMIPGGCCPSIFENAAGAEFIVLSDASILQVEYGLGVFENAGAITKLSAGVSSWAVGLKNTGLVHIQAGELKLTRPGQVGGDWLIDSGAQLSIAGVGFELMPGAQIQGRAVVMDSGTGVGLAVNEDITLEDLTIAPTGRLGGNGTLRIAGTLNNEAGMPTVHIHVLPQGRVESSGVASYFGKMDIEGELHLPAGANMGSFNQPMTVLPGGVVTIDDGATLGSTGLVSQPIDNFALVRKPSTAGTATISNAFNRSFVNHPSGVLRVEGGTLEMVSRLESYGTIDIAAGARYFQRGWANYYEGMAITGDGWYHIEGANNITSGATEIAFPRLRISGNYNAGYGIRGTASLRITKAIELLGGGVQAPFITIDSEAVFECLGPEFTRFDTTIENHGVMNIRSAIGMSYTAVNNHPGAQLTLHGDIWIGGNFGSGPFNNQGRVDKLSGASDGHLDGPITNSGVIEVHAGRLNADALVQTAGGETILHNTGLTIPNITLNGGALRGGGVITGAVTSNAGVIEPGGPIGTLDITGAFTQNAGGMLRVELGGLTPGAQHDRVNVGAAANLNGTLEIVPANGFVPQAGQQFTILTRASGSGAFSAILGHGGGAYAVTYNPTNVVLTVMQAPCVADFDGDSSVGLSDLAVVIGGFGITEGASYMDGDVDGDGDVDLTDLAILLNRFGESCE